jgi:hypothetical protein
MLGGLVIVAAGAARVAERCLSRARRGDPAQLLYLDQHDPLELNGENRQRHR